MLSDICGMQYAGWQAKFAQVRFSGVHNTRLVEMIFPLRPSFAELRLDPAGEA